MRRLLARLSLLAVLPMAACIAEADGPTPYDDDAPVSELDPLFQGAPNNDELPEEGKADAVYPAQFSDLLAFQSPVKSQGSRGVCSIFATIALMEHLYLKAGASNPDFSEQYLQWSAKNEVGDFANTEGSNASSNLEAISEFGIVAETDWPYESFPWSASNDAACTGGENLPTRCYTNGEPPQKARDGQKFKLPAGRWINSRPRSIKGHLFTAKTGVVVGLTFFYQSWNHRRSDLPVNSEYWRKGIVLAPNAKDKEVSLAKRAGHAIEIVGWDDDYEVATVDEAGNVVKDASGNPVMEKGFWIFKNSWGTSGFGIENPHGAGYGYLSMKYVEDWGTAYVSAVPTLDNPPPNPTGTMHSYTATPALSIPDNDATGVASTIDVTDGGSLRSAKVSVDISHTYRGDLVVRLVHGATTVTLSNNAGGADDDLKTTFTVSDLVGRELSGAWRLEVVDTAGQDVGTLNAWGVEVVTQ
jgi:hypothetical protein